MLAFFTRTHKVCLLIHFHRLLIMWSIGYFVWIHSQTENCKKELQKKKKKKRGACWKTWLSWTLVYFVEARKLITLLFKKKKQKTSCPNAHVWPQTQGEHSKQPRKIPTALSELRTGNMYSFPTITACDLLITSIKLKIF